MQQTQDVFETLKTELGKVNLNLSLTEREKQERVRLTFLLVLSGKNRTLSVKETTFGMSGSIEKLGVDRRTTISKLEREAKASRAPGVQELRSAGRPSFSDSAARGKALRRF